MEKKKKKTTSLQELMELFAKSAQISDVPAVRALAAKLTILVAHVQRVDAKIDRAAKHLDKQTEDLAGAVMAIHQQSKQGAASAPSAGDDQGTAAASPPRGGGSPPPNAAIGHEEYDEGTEEEKLIKFAQQGIDSDIAASRGEPVELPPPPVAIAPLRKVNGGKKANAGDAA